MKHLLAIAILAIGLSANARQLVEGCDHVCENQIHIINSFDTFSFWVSAQDKIAAIRGIQQVLADTNNYDVWARGQYVISNAVHDIHEGVSTVAINTMKWIALESENESIKQYVLQIFNDASHAMYRDTRVLIVNAASEIALSSVDSVTISGAINVLWVPHHTTGGAERAHIGVLLAGINQHMVRNEITAPQSTNEN